MEAEDLSLRISRDLELDSVQGGSLWSTVINKECLHQPPPYLHPLQGSVINPGGWKNVSQG